MTMTMRRLSIVSLMSLMVATFSAARDDPGPELVTIRSGEATLHAHALSLLMTEHEPTLRAAVVFSTAGYSWDRSPELRARLLGAARRTTVPLFFIHAENDYSTSSSGSCVPVSPSGTSSRRHDCSACACGLPREVLKELRQ